MKEYTVRITEILASEIKIEADSKEEAIELVQRKYKNCNIILSSENYIDTDFELVDDDNF